jgi:molybdopterin-guanine dinucleotide biosynthesis protein A/rhodanese-related sulfurtransferase
MTVRDPTVGHGAVGAVLCGGGSRRMGTDKATLALDGASMALRVARALHAAGVDEVLAVGGGPDLAEALRGEGVRLVADDLPGAGPLAAVVTALRHAGGRPVLVVACDLLAPSPDAMQACLAELSATDAEVAVATTDDRLQWVHAAWSPAALPALEAAVAEGQRAIHRAAGALRVEPVTGLDPDALADADTPDDLAIWARPGLDAGQAGTLAGMDIPEVDVSELATRRAEGAPLLDVREDDEYAEGHVPGAQHIPLSQVPERAGEIPGDGTVYVICRSGGRSAKAVEHLRSTGVDAVNVAGGTLAWIEAGHDVATGDQPG